jgi:signal transduction histidine kinase
MLTIQDKIYSVIDYFISNRVKSEYTFDGIQFLFKIRLLVAISLSGLVLILLSLAFELFTSNNIVKIISLTVNTSVLTGILVLTKLTKNPLKLLPIALYILLADVMYFSHPENIYRSFSVAYYPYLIIAAVIILNRLHATITFFLSLSYISYLVYYSSQNVVPHLENAQASYLELSWVIILSYILVSFYGNLNNSILRLIAKYKDAIIAERTQTLSGSKMTIIAKIAGGMAHEFNNPLAIMQGYAYKLRTLAESETLSKDSAVHISSRMEMTVNRISQLTSALQSIGNSVGKPEQFVTISASSLVKKAIHLANSDKKSARVVFDDNIEDIDVECVQSQLIQSIANIIDNAIEATLNDQQGWIRLHYNHDEEKDSVTIYVENSGKKLDPQIFSKICEPFYSTKTGPSRVGMGLPIAESVTRMHQGILYMPTNTEFTTFAVEIPRVQPEAVRGSSESSFPK